MKDFAVSSALIVSLFLLPQPVTASDPPSPGAVEDTLRPPPATMPPPEVPPIETPERPPAQVPPGGTPVPVQRFILSGNTLLPESELRSVLSRYEGRPHTLEQIYAIADHLTDLYRHHGYTLAHVVVPAQRIDQGEVQLRVLEGRIGALRVEGTERYQDDVITRRMPSVAAGNPMRAAELERELIRLNDLPGLTARAVVRPGTEFGTSDVVLRVTEDKSAYRLTADNFGRDTIGQWRATAEATWNSPRGIGDQLSLSGLVSESARLTYIRAGYSVPVRLHGDRLGFSFTRADYEVGGAAFADLDIEGASTNFRVEYTRPVVRTRATTFVIGSALSYNMSDVDALGSPISDTRLSLLELNSFWSTIVGRGIAASVTGTVGTNFRSNPQGMRDNAQKFRVRADGNLSIPVATDTILLLRGGAVYSPEPLADTQKFSIGGPWVLRGYQPADARGDFGSYVSTELQHTIRTRRQGQTFFETTFGLFVEAGQAKRRALPGDAPDTDYSDSLRNFGVSMAMNPGDLFSVNMAWARPFKSYPGSDGTTDDQFWLSISAAF